MFSQEGAKNFFSQVLQLWVNPEIERRKLEGSLPKSFFINKCLITFPKDKLPVVKFNDEVHWIALIKKVPRTSFQEGQPVHIHEIESIESVQLPTQDGKPIAFVYFLRESSGNYNIFFDFSPNYPEGSMLKTDRKDEILSKEIAKSFQAKLVEEAIRIQENFQPQLQKIGLWTAPALLPYPLSKIVFQLEKDDVSSAIQTLLSHCTPDFLEKLSNKWWDVKEINMRRLLIESSLSAHREGKYVLSISTMLPHIEGIITDWVYGQKPEMIPWRLDSKTKKFRDIVLKKVTPYSYERIVNSTINFILDGPVLKTFKRWVDDIEKAFPNRHVVEHGKYEPFLYTEENSLKLFLLIDTVYFIIAGQSE